MQFPNEVQAAVLLTAPVLDLESIVRSFRSLLDAKTGAQFNVPEANPGKFYRLFGGDSIMITIEFMPAPGRMEVFQQALQSPYTGLVCPDVRERLTRHTGMVLINVSHGVLGSVAQDPKIAGFLAEIGVGQEGANLPQFKQRLELCALAARFVCDHTEPSLVHWTQSNQLLPVEFFDKAAAMSVPSVLHIHPWLFGPGEEVDGKALAGIRTFGMRHFIGREVIVEPSEIPWAANFETVITFLNIALAKNGYIIPDGDTFGDEDRTQSYRVRHLEAGEGDVPLFELTPLFRKDFDFVAEDFAPFENKIDDRSPPPGVMPEDDGEAMVLANEWREKRSMAQGIGGDFEVRTFETPPPRPTPPSDGSQAITGTGLRSKLFGRKGL